MRLPKFFIRGREDGATHTEAAHIPGGRSVRDQTLFDVCMVLGLDFHGLRDAWHGETVALANGPMELKGDGGMVAPVYMGVYACRG